MKRLFFALLFLASMFLSVPLFAANTMPIAVMDLKPGGVPKLVSKATSDVIRSEFVNIANFKVAERSQINKVVDEQGLQMTGITQGEGVKVGRLLAVQKIVIGELNSVGKKRFTLNLRIVDIESGVSEYSERDTVDSLDDVEKMAAEVAKKLAKRIVQKYKTYFTAKTRSDYYVRGLLPGLGQIYADHDIKGYAFMGVFVAGLAFTGYSYYDYSAKKDDYNSLKLGTPPSIFDSKYDDYQKAADMLTYSLIGVGVIYVLNWVDLIFFSAPDFDGAQKSTAVGTLFLDYDYKVPFAVKGSELCNRDTRAKEHYYELGIGYRF